MPEVRPRIIVWWEVLALPAWRWLVTIPIAVLGALGMFRDELMSPEAAEKYKLLKLVPGFSWHWWVILLLIIVVAILMESTFSAVQSREGKIATLTYSPELEIAFDPENLEQCRLDEGKGWKQFRMAITNRSGKTIHNCLGELVSVQSSLMQHPYVETVPLTWAFQIDRTELNIHNGATRILNVIQINDGKLGGPSKAHFISPANANNPVHPFDSCGEYECTIIVASEETRPKYVRFYFDWTGNRISSIKNVRVVRSLSRQTVTPLNGLHVHQTPATEKTTSE